MEIGLVLRHHVFLLYRGGAVCGDRAPAPVSAVAVAGGDGRGWRWEEPGSGGQGRLPWELYRPEADGLARPAGVAVSVTGLPLHMYLLHL